MKKTVPLLIILCMAGCAPKHKPTPLNEPPAWAKDAVWYQVFVERFHNGDPSNDPTPATISIPPMGQLAPAGWSVTPWGHDWYAKESWAERTGKPFYDNLQYRRYGGDLQGVLDKLDYLQDLGITAIYLNPINDAPSLHKYDARNYHHVDINFGPDPEGDLRIMESEDPADPSTWQWTSADKLFLRVVEEAHRRGMQVIMDYSWNHTGVLFWAWQDILKNQSKSKVKEWYEILSFDDSTTAVNEFTYKGWLDIKNLPELRKVDVAAPRENGRPYEGDINPAAKAHIFDVTRRWLAPDGDTARGIDGFRLDVADQIGLKFWRDYRKFVRSIQPEAYLVGEIWWEDYPETLMDPVPYVNGDVFDAVMFYQVYRPARYFFAKTGTPIDAKQLKDSLELQWNRMKPATLHAMMNVSSTHDAPRLLTSFYNPHKYKYQANPRDNAKFKTGKPDAETYQRLRLYLVHLFTIPGAPHIWNGEEMGMWGADDPDCRKPLWWEGMAFDPETRTNIRKGKKLYDSVGFDREQFEFYKKLIDIRKSNPVLAIGQVEFLIAEGNKLGYRRYDGRNEILVLFNLEPRPVSFDLPGNTGYTDLLHGGIISGDSVGLNPLSALVLKREH
ncbi:MAG: alpha-amylase [Bacteroidetes bacterium]|nr:MAG: alpha-amylase [Bacteroidota bacterium]